jgi:hypothetical protein
MSERKVLSKYYPPGMFRKYSLSFRKLTFTDFDPSKLSRSRAPKNAGPKVMTVRLMAPFPMKCTSCGEYIYKGRKFNARKETTEEKYLNIPIYRFFIRCTRCSAEITFKTDPKNMDYSCERGAKRNFEPWRANGNGVQESEEEMLERLEREDSDRNAMEELEMKTSDTRMEMAVADALDEIRTRNARNERVGKDGVEVLVSTESLDKEREIQEREDEEAARRAFARRIHELEVVEDLDTVVGNGNPEDKYIPSTRTRAVRRKRDYSAALGIRKTVRSTPAP